MLSSEEFGKLRIRDFYGTDVVEMLHWFTFNAPSVIVCNRSHYLPHFNNEKTEHRVTKEPNTANLQKSVHLATALYYNLTVILQ